MCTFTYRRMIEKMRTVEEGEGFLHCDVGLVSVYGASLYKSVSNVSSLAKAFEGGEWAPGPISQSSSSRHCCMHSFHEKTIKR